MQKPQFAKNEIYHIYNRGVEKRKIFLDNQDYLRFIHDLFEFNDENPVFNLHYYFNSRSESKKSINLDPQYLITKRRPRKLLVEILVFVLMPNHFHLLLRQKKENGIVKFMHKIGTGYTMYFNQKYERVGGLFQGRFKAVLVKRDAHFIHLPYYIHLNPLDIIYRGSTSIDSINKNVIKSLMSYRWSSLPDYIGKKNFPSVTSRNFLLRVVGGEKEYKKQIKNWIKEKQEHVEKIKDLILE